MEDLPRDRLRELLDAVLDDDHPTLSAMANGALSSPFHLSRLVTRHVGEPPVALRRRVLLERAAWRLQRGASVTDVAWESGYESVEGFSRAFARAFGHPPSAMPPPTERGHWLASPNGVHFHGPTVLYVDAADGVEEVGAGDVTAVLVRHDLDDVRALIDLAAELDDQAYRQVRLPGSRAIAWDGPDESIAEVLRHLVLAKVPWLATVEGA
ncbi:MAG: helix-turn-helix domain-containing protein [Aeromicrobium erythreum]